MTGNVDELCDNACIDINDKRWSVRGGCCLDEASESFINSKKPLGTNCLVGFRLALGNSGIREEGYVDLGLSVKWAKCNLGAKLLKMLAIDLHGGKLQRKKVLIWKTINIGIIL